MGYASRSGRARTSATNPQAHAICDRCGFRYNHVDLSWQFDWAGASLINKRILVCAPCNDKPQTQLRAIVLPADPTPIMNARTQDFVTAETDYITAQTPTTYDVTTGIPIPHGDTLTTEDGINITAQPVGPPLGLAPGAVMPLNGSVHFDILLPVMSITSTGTNVVTVTCSAAHGLSDNDQVSIYGTSSNQIMGFFSVTVISATAFSYEIIPFISAGSYLTGTTRVATCSVGLPFGYIKIPIVDIIKAEGASTPYFFINNSNQPIYFTNNGGDVLLWSFTP